MTIRQALPGQASEIATLMMEAMNAECCQNLAGPHHTLADFHDLLTALVSRQGTQYSYANTLVALSDDGRLMGIAISYDGANLLRLRQAFIDEARERLQMDHSVMAPETEAGELYLDSLCVVADFRHQGVATALIRATEQKARRLGISKVGLLVDKGNPRAERLYRSLGFQFVNDTAWGGHAQRHLQLDVDGPSSADE